MTDYKLPKNVKIKSSKQIRQILDYKLYVKNNLMNLYLAPNEVGHPRFAVLVSSKIRSAVARNRLKRLAREIFRLNRHLIPSGFDYLIIFPSLLSKNAICDIKRLSLKEIKDSFLKLIEQAQKIIEKRENKN